MGSSASVYPRTLITNLAVQDAISGPSRNGYRNCVVRTWRDLLGQLDGLDNGVCVRVDRALDGRVGGLRLLADVEALLQELDKADLDGHVCVCARLQQIQSACEGRTRDLRTLSCCCTRPVAMIVTFSPAFGGSGEISMDWI